MITRRFRLGEYTIRVRTWPSGGGEATWFLRGREVARFELG